MPAKHTEWYKSWFDSPYYHILYDNRNEAEAYNFIGNLVAFLKPQPGSSVLDLACGAGRFSNALAEAGFNVTGLDLSKKSIAKAKTRYEREELEFYVHDMRHYFRVNYFDIVLNLFTSFGYFENPTDNAKTLRSVHHGLKAGGTFVLDFLNTEKSMAQLVPQETTTKQGITFHISRQVKSDKFVKDIEFSDQGEHYHFQEKVQALTLPQFEALFKSANLEIRHTFGNYDLETFDTDASDRLIIVAEKIA